MRSADLGEVFDEASVEVGEPDKASDFFEVLRCSSIRDGLHFD